MSSVAISLLVLAAVLAGLLAGLLAGSRLPEHHVTSDSRDAVKLGIATVATLSSLVLGILIGTTKGTYDGQAEAVRQLSAKLLLLDRMLDLYGAETRDARDRLRTSGEETLARLWPDDGQSRADLTPGESAREMHRIYDEVAGLSPKSEAQRFAQASALQGVTQVVETRYQLFVHDASFPTVMLVVLTSWLAILFGVYALLAPRNVTAIGVLLVCAFCASGAIFLMLELAEPFDGLMRVSSHPLREALALVGK